MLIPTSATLQDATILDELSGVDWEKQDSRICIKAKAVVEHLMGRLAIVDTSYH